MKHPYFFFIFLFFIFSNSAKVFAEGGGNQGGSGGGGGSGGSGLHGGHAYFCEQTNKSVDQTTESSPSGLVFDLAEAIGLH